MVLTRLNCRPMAGKGASDTLELAVTVSKEEALQSTFTSEYPEQQGASGTTFTFDTTIVNNRATEQSYALAADVPTGWQATFTPSGETTNVASLIRRCRTEPGCDRDCDTAG